MIGRRDSAAVSGNPVPRRARRIVEGLCRARWWLGVLAANAWSSDDGMALARFKVESSFGPVVPWDRVRIDLERAFAGRLALTARLDDRARTYASRRTAAATPVRVGVAFDNRASAGLAPGQTQRYAPQGRRERRGEEHAEHAHAVDVVQAE